MVQDLAFAVFEAAVQLLPDGLGEATDFAIMGQVHNFYGRIYPDLPGFTRKNCFHMGIFIRPDFRSSFISANRDRRIRRIF